MDGASLKLGMDKLKMGGPRDRNTDPLGPESPVRLSDSTFRALLEAAPDAFVILNPEGRIEIVNAEAERVFGYTRQELQGKPVEFLIPDRFRRSHEKHRAAYNSSPHRRPMGAGMELVGKRKDGSEFPAEIRLSPLKTENELFVISVVRDITARKQAEDRLIYLSQYDHLTGLTNRTLFRDRLSQALTRADRNKQQVAVLFLDLDRFKAINDTLGHGAGDLLLAELAGRLSKSLRKVDTVARSQTPCNDGPAFTTAASPAPSRLPLSGLKPKTTRSIRVTSPFSAD